MTAVDLSADHIQVGGRSVHLSMATTFIRQLAKLRDSGRPVVLQDSAAALNTEQTSPEGVQALLDDAVEQLSAWLAAIRAPRDAGPD